MSAEIVYRSEDPEIVSAFAGYVDDLTAYRASVRAVLHRLGLSGYRIWASDSGWRPGEFRGIDVPHSVPAGWKRHRGTDLCVPDNRKAAGKRITAELAQLRHPGCPCDRLKGMPSELLSGYGIEYPGVREMAGAVWVWWPRTDPGERREVDLAVWSKAKLSEYHAAKEAADEEVQQRRAEPVIRTVAPSAKVFTAAHLAAEDQIETLCGIPLDPAEGWIDIDLKPGERMCSRCENPGSDPEQEALL